MRLEQLVAVLEEFAEMKRRLAETRAALARAESVQRRSVLLEEIREQEHMISRFGVRDVEDCV